MKYLQKRKIGLRHSFKQPLLLQTVVREHIGQVEMEDQTKRTIGFYHNFCDAGLAVSHPASFSFGSSAIASTCCLDDHILEVALIQSPVYFDRTADSRLPIFEIS